MTAPYFKHEWMNQSIAWRLVWRYFNLYKTLNRCFRAWASRITGSIEFIIPQINQSKYDASSPSVSAYKYWIKWFDSSSSSSSSSSCCQTQVPTHLICRMCPCETTLIVYVHGHDNQRDSEMIIAPQQQRRLLLLPQWWVWLVLTTVLLGLQKKNLRLYLTISKQEK